MKKLRWGVLGTGRIVDKAGRGIQRAENSEWLGVAGRNMENSSKSAEKYGVPRAYESYQALLDDPDIDAVYIALLNHLHKDWAIAALRAGKHILLEKPFTLNWNDAIKVVAAARENHLLVKEAHVWKYYEAFRYTKQMIKDGIIGDIGLFTSHFSFIAASDSTRWFQEWGGGALYDIGCYPVAWSRYFLDGEPESVECRMFDSSTGVDSRFSGTLYFTENRIAQVSAALDLPGGSGCEWVGTKGSMRLTMQANAEEMTISLLSKEESQQWTSDRITPFTLQVEDFTREVLQREGAHEAEMDALQQMKVLDALRSANRSSCRVHL